MIRALALLALAVALAGCGAPDVPAPDGAARSSERAPFDPDLVVAAAEETVRLGDHRGHVVVMHLAAAGDDTAWAALADAAADLEAEGAAILGIVTEGRLDGSALPFSVRHADGTAWAEPLGFAGDALTVVVGPQGRLRGRSVGASGDDIVMLAAPVLLELDGPEPPIEIEMMTAATVEAMVRRGAALIDLREAGEPLAHALAIPLARLSPDVLPLDPATPLVFVGPDAPEAATRAGGWGFAEAHALRDPTGLELAAPIDALPVYDARDELPRVRG